LVISLDTNVMVDLINGKMPQVRERYDAVRDAGDRIVTCSVAAYELLFGALVSRRPEIQRPTVEAFLAGIEIVDWTYGDGVATAQIRRGLYRRGTPIGEHDLLIAGQALNRGWAVASSNLREFLRVDTLELYDWRVT
jgi:tRNA(fMet)-specific endonuclease VapC